jgi:hypothetical protein
VISVKAVFITAVTIVVLLLLSILIPVGGPTPAVESQTGVSETAVLGTSKDIVSSNRLAQPAPIVSTPPAAAPDALFGALSANNEEARNDGDEEKGVPVSSYGVPGTAALSAPAATLVVPTAQPIAPIDAPVLVDAELESFTASLSYGQADQVVGVYVPGVFGLPVVQQPGDQASYVSDQDDTVTQFSSVSPYGSIGLLAHNYLSGERFFGLGEGQEVVILHGEGHQERYRIKKIDRYQALTPTSVYSNFIDLADPTQAIITAGELFNRIYTKPDQLVFQTCIEANGNPSWGRIFITAERIQ